MPIESQRLADRQGDISDQSGLAEGSAGGTRNCPSAPYRTVAFLDHVRGQRLSTMRPTTAGGFVNILQSGWIDELFRIEQN